MVGALEAQCPDRAALTGGLVRKLAELNKTQRGTLLTARQMDVLRLVATGTRYRDIAESLSLSETSVNREMRNIFDRLGVNDAAHAVSEAHQRGLFKL